MNILRWTLFWMPFWGSVALIFLASTRPPSPQLVLRPDLMAVVGVPTPVLWIGALVAALFLGALCTLFRPEWKALSQRPKGASLVSLMVPFAAIGVWALWSWSNIAWANAPLEIHRTRVVGSYLNKKTPYIELRDWRAANAPVYLNYDPDLLRESPPPSEIEVQTQPGFWGYELIYGTRPVRGQKAN